MHQPSVSTFHPARMRSQTTDYGKTSSVIDHNSYDIRYYASVDYQQFRASIDREKNVFYFPGNTLAMSRFKPDSIMHLVHDDLLPMWATLREHNLIDQIDRVFFRDVYAAHLGQELLQWLPFERVYERQVIDQDSLLCFEHLYTGKTLDLVILFKITQTVLLGMTNTTLWYQYGFTRPQGPLKLSADQFVYIRNTIQFVRAQLLERLNLDTCDPSTARHILLVVRKHNRKILNVEELRQHISAKYGQVKVLELEKQSFENIEDLLANFICASIVIGMHGSELVLSLFMSADEHLRPTLIEIFPYGVEPDNYQPYRTMCNLLEFGYEAWSNPTNSNTVYHPEYPAHLGGLDHLTPTERQDILDKLQQPLEQHLCCENRHWLYRIYQDTRIDLELFDVLLTRLHSSNLTGKENEMAMNYHLAYVLSIECQLLNDTHLYVGWRPPWNIIFIEDQPVLQYQVLVQPVHSQQAIVMQASAETITFHSPTLVDQCRTVGCNIWVKPIVPSNSTIGPYRLVGTFSNRPYHCLV